MRARHRGERATRRLMGWHAGRRGRHRGRSPRDVEDVPRIGRMMRYVTDTHGLYWHLSDNPRLSPTARQIFHDADRGVNQIVVPGITLIEMVYLVERNRIVRAHMEQLFAILQSNPKKYMVSTLDLNTARAISLVPRTRVPDESPTCQIASSSQPHFNWESR